MTAPTQNTFEDLYRESTKDGGPIVPWDSKDAKPRIKELALLGAVRGDVLDIGCGLGDNAIYLAQQGFNVTGLDFAPSAIEQAKGRAAAAGVTIDFQVADATKLDGWDSRFDTVIDSGVYHCFDNEGTAKYASALHRATRPGARWYIWCFAHGGGHRADADRQWVDRATAEPDHDGGTKGRVPQHDSWNLPWRPRNTRP
ncbi:MAG: class I SAM-dependent methyltransferase, partial [[Mycobacterium] stephanolepidis]